MIRILAALVVLAFAVTTITPGSASGSSTASKAGLAKIKTGKAKKK